MSNTPEMKSKNVLFNRLGGIIMNQGVASNDGRVVKIRGAINAVMGLSFNKINRSNGDDGVFLHDDDNSNVVEGDALKDILIALENLEKKS